jgi:hypothetical protein
MGAGICAVTMGVWLPRVKAAYDHRTSIAETLSATVASSGMDHAVQQYHDLKAAAPAAYNFDEDELNRLGYEFIGAHKVKEAIRILQLNVEAYPQSSNVYDSLGEASAYLITFATVVYVNFGIHGRLIAGNNAETARNILAHERLFRIGIARRSHVLRRRCRASHSALRDSQAGQSGPGPARRILEARMGLDVACYDASIFLMLCGSSVALITCGLLKRSACRLWRVSISARVLTTITLLCCLAH